MTGARKLKVAPSLSLPQHARILLAIRRKNNWTQAELALELGVHPSTIANWERGITDPHPSWVPRLNAFLGA